MMSRELSGTSRCWWEGAALDRLIADLFAAELQRMRPGRTVAALPWSTDLPLGDDGLGADSLERLRLAEAVAQMLDLPDAPDALLTAATPGEVAAEARRLLPKAGGGLSFLTSGSTGQPKTVRHDERLLWQEVDALARLVPDARRILSVVPAQAIYGFLFTVFLPERLAVPVLDLRRQRRAALPAQVGPGDLIVATPPTWTELAAADWPAGIVGVTSGAPCAPDVAAALRGRGLRLIEIYGSTETGGIGWRDDEREPFRLMPYWERDGDLIRRRADGADLIAELPDHAEWLEPDRLRPTRRRDRAVQVAGVNVHPDKVAAVLRAHPEVADARVRLMRPDEGPWIKAFVVPRDVAGSDGLQARLGDWTRTRLTAPERPRAITLGPALPVTAAGKPGDWFIDDA